MSMIITENSTIELWLKLVRQAGQACHRTLDEELESYLVYMLVRHLQDTDLADKALAIAYLQGMQAQGQAGIKQLQHVADQCLLCSGLFPKRTRRRLVSPGYTIDLGRSAYMQLAERVRKVYADLYEKLSCHFVTLMDILQALRFSADSVELDSLYLIDSFQHNDSRFARQQLEKRHGHAKLCLPERKTLN